MPNSRIMELLRRVETVDITTTGRRSGEPRRIEIWMYEVDGRFVITGTPGPRDWYANLMADPALMIHLPDGTVVPAIATPVADREVRHSVFTAEKTWWYRSQTTVDDLIANSPMVELSFPEQGTNHAISDQVG